MILLLGGTNETAEIAQKLCALGHRLLVSKATDVELDIGTSPRIELRSGPLDEEGFVRLIGEKRISALVDATHPYAAEVRATARRVAERTHLSYFTFVRPPDHYDYDRIAYADDHEQAAEIAFSFARPVLLTTGSRNLAPYMSRAEETGVPLYARVLSHPASIEACHTAGLKDTQVVTGRGPFSIHENVTLIKKFSIGVLVSKESGASGGVPEKIEAARREECDVVLVKRPAQPFDNAYTDIAGLIDALRGLPVDERNE